MELFEKVLGVIEALIAFANLLVVIFVYNRDKKEKKNQEEEDRRERRNQEEDERKFRKEQERSEKREKWFDEVIIKRVTYAIDDFFNENNCQVETIVHELKTENAMEKNIEQFNQQFYKLKHIVRPALKTFDKKLDEEVNEILNEYCDLYTVQLESCFQRKIVVYKIKDAPDEYKYKILNLLYTYNVAGLG